MVRIRYREAPYYSIYSSLLLLSPSYAQIPRSALYSHTWSAYVPPLMLQTLTSSTNKYDLINIK